MHFPSAPSGGSAIAWPKSSNSIRATVRFGLLATAVVTVLIGGLGTLAISREVSVHQTQAFLLRTASALAILFERANHRFVHPFLATAGVGRLHLVPLSRSNRPLVALPHPITPSTINFASLVSGHYQSGVIGNEVYLAYPVTTPFSFHSHPLTTTLHSFALILTHPLPSIEGPVIFVVGAVLITAIVAVSISDHYAAHISRTLDLLVTRSRRIASGHLDDEAPLEKPRESELANLDDAISSMITSLKAANEVESTYILAISHDLRTPLTSIRGFAEAIIDEAVVSPVEAARTIEREAQRIERLINDLIALARLRASNYTLEPQQIDLNALLEHLVEAVGPRAQRSAVSLNAHPMSQPAIVQVDPERLLQLLGNLLDNALKYAIHEVEVRLEPTPHAINVTITDDGRGLSPDLREKLFHHQLNPTPGRDGTVGSGLGLLIVGRLAGHMGLNVRVDSPVVLGRGTRFVITIPRVTTTKSQPTVTPSDAIRSLPVSSPESKAR
ncbi:MAG: sensor histidine kinase [Ferrimicrobium sp.]